MANEFNTQDFTEAFKSMFKNVPGVPADFSAFTDSAKEVAEFNTKLNAIALTAAKQNAELSAKWTQDVLAQVTGLNKPQDQPADYAEVVSEAAAAQVKETPERISQFAEIAKKSQVEAVELIMNTTKDLQAKAVKA